MTQASPEENQGADDNAPLLDWEAMRASIGASMSPDALVLRDFQILPKSQAFVAASCVTAVMGGQMTPKEYKELVLSRVQVYLKQSKRKKIIHTVLQLTIFVGAALITVTLAVPDVPKLIPAVLGGVVAIATGVVNYYKFGERSQDLFRTAEELGLEYNRFDTNRGVYKHLDLVDAFELFMDRVETIIHEDTQRWMALEKSSVEQKPSH